MNQIFDNSHFAPSERTVVFRPGEAIVIKEIRTSAIEIIRRLDLAGNFSDTLMKYFRHNMPLVFVLAMDAATGYIQSANLSKRSDHRTALCLLEEMMRDKTGWIEKAYPMSMHCTPRTILVEEGQKGFRHDYILTLLEIIGCELETLAGEIVNVPLLDQLEAQIKTRPVIAHRPRSAFDNRVTAWGSKSDGALEQLNLHLMPVIAAYNHFPSQIDGRSLHDRMARYERAPVPDAASMRFLFGQRRTRTINPDGKLMVWGIPYAAAPGEVERLYSRTSERLVSIDHWNLFNISVKGDDGNWYEMRNTLEFDDPTDAAKWRHIVWSMFKTGKLSFSDFDLNETETFEKLDMLDELFAL